MFLFIHLLFFPIHKIIIVNIFSTYIKKKIYLVLAAPGLCCCTGAAFQPQRLGFSLGRSLCSEQGLRSAAAPGLLPGTVSLQQAGAELCRSAWASPWDSLSAASRGCALPQCLGSSLGRFLCSEQGLRSAAAPGLLTGTVSLAVEHGL